MDILNKFSFCRQTTAWRSFAAKSCTRIVGMGKRRQVVAYNAM
jgi:hypothetical protein